MTILLAPDAWRRRAHVLDGSLGALADGMARDLDAVLAHPVFVPAEKALLSREGGRCPRDGSLLEFDPFEPDRHRCAVCGAVYEGAYHRGFWLYWYHLWLAERALHAAVLHRLRGDERLADFAAAVLEGYAARYLTYPDQDSALGPSRPFFSTYLESIWLLQLALALDALEGAEPGRFAPLGGRVRDRLVEPSVALIASFDEHTSNRQVWNVAAQMAAHRLLGDQAGAVRVAHAGHGLTHLLANGLLADGTWYEGENYHLFAHRGLWYGVTIADAAGIPLPRELVARFDAGFLAPFLTALPDLTLPSRRDSQYAISLRQPRFAELCELGLARRDDPALAAVLATLYDGAPDLPVGSNGRSRTSADVERNLPGMRLTRAELGWRALLFARPELPPARPGLPGSVLLEGQGIAVLRRAGRIYAALDYGHSGGGHGHPDRLNLLLVDGASRWLDDMGTGSYVERTLHWYRSTLAHNAPLADGHSQARVDGTLVAYDERGGAGWVRARATGIARGVDVQRTLVVMPDYLVDEVVWSADRDTTVDLPIHTPLEPGAQLDWEPASLTGGGEIEDGFDFVTSSARTPLPPGGSLELVSAAARTGDAAGDVRAHVSADGAAEWWQLEGPGAPGSSSRRFHLVRMAGRTGRVRAVWTWVPDAAHVVTFAPDAIAVEHAGGRTERHAETADGWHVELRAGSATSSIDLGGVRPAREPATPAAGVPNAPGERAGGESLPTVLAADDALDFTLGEADYRRSEVTWVEAGSPMAVGTIAWDGRELSLSVRVTKRDPLVIVPRGAENPLDNEIPEINGDGVQFYAEAGERAGGWTIVPVAGEERARAVPVRGWVGLELAGTRWAAFADGFEIEASVELPDPGVAGAIVRVGVIVNETAPERARRRGQLVLGGADGEWVYLRGDRIDRGRLLPIRLVTGELS